MREQHPCQEKRTRAKPGPCRENGFSKLRVWKFDSKTPRSPAGEPGTGPHIRRRRLSIGRRASAIRNKLLLRPERDFVQGITGVLLGGAAVAIARLLDEAEFLGFELERHARHLVRWGDLPRRGAIVAAIHP